MPAGRPTFPEWRVHALWRTTRHMQAVVRNGYILKRALWDYKCHEAYKNCITMSRIGLSERSARHNEKFELGSSIWTMRIMCVICILTNETENYIRYTNIRHVWDPGQPEAAVPRSFAVRRSSLLFCSSSSFSFLLPSFEVTTKPTELFQR